MKKIKNISFLLFLAILVLFSLTPIAPTKATPPSNLNGRILLQVESHGEAWYVNPKDGLRYYMADGNAAFNIMRTLSLGMSNKDIERMKTDATYRKKFIGQILLQVESHGEAYYISFDGRYNYLKDGAAAYDIMRKLSLGITNANLNKIKESVASVPKCDSFECLVSLTKSCANGSGGSVTFERKSTEDTSRFGRYTYSVIFYGYNSENLCKMNMKMESSIITTDTASIMTDEEVRQLGKETNMSAADIESYIKMKNGGVMSTVSQSCVGKNSNLANIVNKWKNIDISDEPNVTCVVE